MLSEKLRVSERKTFIAVRSHWRQVILVVSPALHSVAFLRLCLVCLQVTDGISPLRCALTSCHMI